MGKVKLAMHAAAGCGGCDVSVLDLHERILEVAGAAELLFWPMFCDGSVKDLEEYPDRHLDASLFNGAIRNSEDEHMARLLRQKSRVLVAFGSCAHLGGIPGLANLNSLEELLRVVYQDTPSTVNPKKSRPTELYWMPPGELRLPRMHGQVLALDEVVRVDQYLPGCPPAVEQLWALLRAIVQSELPPPGAVVGASNIALCDECERSKGEKRIKAFRDLASFVPDPEVCFLEQGVICCGPATRSGCGGRCGKANMPCRGCYGPPDDVEDQGAKLLSSIASVIDSDDPAEIGRIVEQVRDPAGTFYRYSLPSAFLSGACREEAS